MNPRKAIALGLMALLSALVSGAAFADASYQSTTQVTGGQLVDSLKSISFLSKSMKDAFAPVSMTTMVRGNRKATVSKESIEIVDLDKEEMIHVDLIKKTYSVVTFAQMRQAMQQMPEKLKEAEAQANEPQGQPKPNIKTSYSVDVKNTGAQKDVNGLTAQEQLITLTMTVTNLDAPASGQSGPNTATLVVTADAWIAPDPPEVKEIQDFDARMGKKMMEGVDAQAWLASMRNSNPGMGQMLGGQPGASEAMAQMAKEMEKLKGTHVLDVVSMGALAPAGSAQANQSAQTNSAGGNSAGTTAGQVAGDTAAQTAANESSSRMGSFGSALGGSIMGAWHKKKSSANNNSNNTSNTSSNSNTDTNASSNSNANSNASVNTNSTTAASSDGSTGAAGTVAANGPAPANGSAQGTQTVVLISTTTQKSNFSGAAVPPSACEVPAGFTQVMSPMANMQ
jgi:hypothetical protein